MKSSPTMSLKPYLALALSTLLASGASWARSPAIEAFAAPLDRVASGASVATAGVPWRPRDAAAPSRVVFTVANGEEPTSLDPVISWDLSNQRIAMALFEGLTVYDPKTCRAVPGIAESWSFNADFTQVTFRLRRNARFSDGTRITARAVADSWLRAVDPATGAEWYYMIADFVKGADEFMRGVDSREKVGIRAVGDFMLVVDLVRSTPFFADVVAHVAYAVVPVHAIARLGNRWTEPGYLVSSGPFALKTWIRNDRVVVERNPAYWDAKSVALDEVVFLPYGIGYDSGSALETGALDWICSLPQHVIDEYRANAHFLSTPEYATYYFVFNVTKPPFDDAKVRKAFAMAIDKAALVEGVTRGGELVADSLVPPGEGYRPPAGNGFDPATARSLLAQAGYSASRRLPPVTLLFNTSERHMAICEFVARDWRDKLAAAVNLEDMGWSDFLRVRQTTHEFMIARAGWIADYDDPTTFLDMFRSDSSNNDGLNFNPRYDALLDEASRTAGEKRYSLLAEAERILVEEDQAVIPVYRYATAQLVNLKRWDGWFVNALNVHPLKFIRPKAGSK